MVLNIKADKILCFLSEKRTLPSAKVILKDKEFLITSSGILFEEFLDYLEENILNAIDIISVIIDDIQRMLIYRSLVDK